MVKTVHRNEVGVERHGECGCGLRACPHARMEPKTFAHIAQVAEAVIETRRIKLTHDSAVWHEK